MNSVTEQKFDFANILFSWNCNAKCPYCIGQQLDITYPSNLDEFPLKNFDALLWLIEKHQIPELIFTGTTTDPLLYRHQDKLLDTVEWVIPEVRRAIHTNGFLIMKKLEQFNRYTKCTLSLPSFNKEVFEVMMGTKQQVPNIEAIFQNSDIPIKVSRIVNPTNNLLPETNHYLETIARTPVQRITFRKLAGDMSSWDETITHLEALWGKPYGSYRDNPIYRVWDIEITLWSFDTTESRSINLFSNGHLSHEYLLSKSEK